VGLRCRKVEWQDALCEFNVDDPLQSIEIFRGARPEQKSFGATRKLCDRSRGDANCGVLDPIEHASTFRSGIGLFGSETTFVSRTIM